MNARSRRKSSRAAEQLLEQETREWNGEISDNSRDNRDKMIFGDDRSKMCKTDQTGVLLNRTFQEFPGSQKHRMGRRPVGRAGSTRSQFLDMCLPSEDDLDSGLHARIRMSRRCVELGDSASRRRDCD